MVLRQCRTRSCPNSHVVHVKDSLLTMGCLLTTFWMKLRGPPYEVPERSTQLCPFFDEEPDGPHNLKQLLTQHPASRRPTHSPAAETAQASRAVWVQSDTVGAIPPKADVVQASETGSQARHSSRGRCHPRATTSRALFQRAAGHFGRGATRASLVRVCQDAQSEGGCVVSKQHLLISLSPDELGEIIAQAVRRELVSAPTSAPGYVTTDDIAKHFQVSRDTVTRQWVDQGCPCIRVGRQCRLKIADVEAWLIGRGQA